MYTYKQAKRVSQTHPDRIVFAYGDDCGFVAYFRGEALGEEIDGTLQSAMIEAAYTAAEHDAWLAFPKSANPEDMDLAQRVYAGEIARRTQEYPWER